MNVSTQYYPGTRYGSRMHDDPVPSAIERVNSERVYLDARLSGNHEARHAANMEAWRELHAEHMAAGRYEIAANIMTLKIIPNIA